MSHPDDRTPERDESGTRIIPFGHTPNTHPDLPSGGDLGGDAGEQGGETTQGLRIAAALEEIYKAGLKNLEGEITRDEVIAKIADFDAAERFQLMLLLSQQSRFFFRMYQAECLSPIPSPLQSTIYGLGAGVGNLAAEFIQTTIPGFTPELAEASDRQAKAFAFRIKQRLLAMVRGQVILPPGVQGGPPKTE